MNTRLLLVFLLCIWPVNSGHSADHKEESPLSILVFERPPYFFRDSNGDLIGSMAERIKSWAARYGRPVNFRYIAWSRALQAASTRPNTLLMPLTRTAEREDAWHWHLELFTSRYQFLTRREHANVDIASLDLASGDWTAVCNKGSFHCDLLRQQGFPDESIIVLSASTLLPDINLVLKGRADFIFDNLEAVRLILGNAGGDPASIVPLDGYEVERTDYIASKIMPVKVEPHED